MIAASTSQTCRGPIRSFRATNKRASVAAPHGNYLIFYRIADDTVEVLHVLHGARDYENILFPEE